jgi:hypothetical protein
MPKSTQLWTIITIFVIFLIIIAFKPYNESFEMDIDINKLSCLDYVSSEPALAHVWANVSGNEERKEVLSYLNRAMNPTFAMNGALYTDTQKCIVRNDSKDTLHINNQCRMQDFNNSLTVTNTNIKPSGCVVDPRSPWFLQFLDKAYYWKNMEYVNQIRQLQLNNQNLSNEVQNVNTANTQLSGQLSNTQGQVSVLNTQVVSSQAQIASLNQQISRLQAERNEYMLRSMMSGVPIRRIFDNLANSLNEFKNPSFYEYNLDGNSTYIADGGGDMYDWGNYTHIMVNGGYHTINYSNTDGQTTTFSGIPIEHVSLGYRRPLMYFCKTNHRVNLGFRKTGNVGADGGGRQEVNIVYNDARIRNYRVFAWRRIIYSAWDPSVCDLYFAFGDNTSVFYNTNMSVGNSWSTDDNLSFFTMDTANVLFGCSLLSKPGGAYISVQECQSVINAIINRLP